jgi:hypothetical protein
LERLRKLAPESYQDKTRPKLRNAKPTSVEHAPVCFITQAAEFLEKLASVIVEAGTGESGDILQLYDCGPGFCNQAKGFREQISFILMPKLFPRDGKGRTRNASREKIDSAKL